MKYTTLLPFAAAAATAFVIPDEVTAKGLVPQTELKAEETPSSWWDRVPSLGDIRSFAEDTIDDAYDTFEHQAGKLNAYVSEVGIEPEVPDFFLSPFAGDDEDDEAKPPGHGRHGRPGRGGRHGFAANLTVYQAIHASNYTKRFAALVDDYPEIVEKLNATDANVTAFVPTDKAFDKIPDHHPHDGKKPPKEFIEKLLQYHVVPGLYPAGHVLAHHTLPTALTEGALDDRAQRIRVSVGIFGARLNFYSKIVAANIVCFSPSLPFSLTPTPTLYVYTYMLT